MNIYELVAGLIGNGIGIGLLECWFAKSDIVFITNFQSDNL